MAKPNKALRSPRWQVVAAEFELSAPSLDHCPAATVPEIAVAGRSNVGKSSLLNTFARRTGLARVSRTPGRTRLLNFFRLRMRGPGAAELGLRLVDLPGYGFAKARREVRDAFGPMIEGYLREREALRGLLVLIDARRGPLDVDFELLEFCAAIELPCLVCATKCDKLGASERGLLPRRFAASLGVDPRDVLLTSSSSGLGLSAVDRRGGLGDELARLARDRSQAGAPEAPAGPGEGSDDEGRGDP
ncbi:putative GTP-binding protein EngB [Enhygromyxa salina]|uniref:Probable GTP-binding protein EngB n=1 Tax=Enhygromyxa salina TaxID=215803 RepID=A0A2S9YFZ9_9BACT|nr:ribosome biogenesis GTP-binding protein YihA/YsxC [Enhygromyxa salina]PRQ04033.1 putative GTP-binding protein EngB [Enhygromyxa salina]